MATDVPEKQERHCRECGGDLAHLDKRAVFCSLAHKSRYNNRRVTRGGIVYDLAMEWRKNRSKEALSNLCHQIGVFLDQDKNDGRQSHNSYDDQPIPYHIPPDDPVVGKRRG